MEPKWNVKLRFKFKNGSQIICINGTKVECKVWRISITFVSRLCINGTKVECKE